MWLVGQLSRAEGLCTSIRIVTWIDSVKISRPGGAFIATLASAPFAVAQSTALDFALQATPDLSSSSPHDASVGDFDGDGLLDVAVACSGSDSGFGVVTVLFGAGYPSFDDQEIATGGAPWGVCAADLNGDGLDDLAIANGGSFSSDVRIYRSLGNGDFAPGPVLQPGGFPLAVKSADLDEDGNADLVVACNTSGGLKCYLGNGDGTLGAPLALSATNPSDLALGDIDGDGHVDIAYSHYDGARV
jgi:hypothetical protein